MGHLTEGEIAEFCSAWCEAEDSLKDVEGEMLRLPQQPINELRYATRHFSRAILAADQETCRREYDAATRHCKAAAYDTAEAVLLYRLLRFKEFKESFKDFPIETPVLDYKAAVVAYRAAQRAISRDPEARLHRRAQVLAASATLAEFDECLDDARDELNKKRKRSPQTEEGTHRRWRGTLLVAGITALFTSSCTIAAKMWFDGRDSVGDVQPQRERPPVQPHKPR